MSCYLYENHRGSSTLILLNVLGVLGVLNVLYVLHMLHVLHVLHGRIVGLLGLVFILIPHFLKKKKRITDRQTRTYPKDVGKKREGSKEVRKKGRKELREHEVKIKEVKGCRNLNEIDGWEQDPNMYGSLGMVHRRVRTNVRG